MEAQINKFENTNNASQIFDEKRRRDQIHLGPSPSCDNLTAVERRLRDKSTTQVQILKRKNQKTKIEMKFLDISQPKMWGFNFGAKAQGERDNSLVERADEGRNTFLADYK